MMHKIFRCALAVAFVIAAASSAAAGDVKVTLNQGLVTIIANDAPISQILSEWARVGQTKFVNAEKMMMVVSLQLVDVPERKALDIILRSASGFMAAERQTPLAGASVFDRIMILPYSRPPAAAAIASSPMPQPFNPPRPPQFTPQAQQDDDAPVMPPGVGQQNQPTGQMTAPMPGMLPQPGQQPQNGAPQPQTLPRPGFLPPPAGPQQPVPFGTPVPGKPPGGGGGGQVNQPDRR